MVGSFAQEVRDVNKGVNVKMDDIKKEVMDGHEKILKDIRKTSENISKRLINLKLTNWSKGELL